MFNSKVEKRNRRHKKIRSRVFGTATKPRLAVFKSNKNLVAQIINDESGETLVHVWTKGMDGKTLKERVEVAGKKLAEDAKAKGIETVVFDRGGFIFAGNIKTLAESARTNGLKF
jgi:large subunit ribosomal protein L18